MVHTMKLKAILLLMITSFAIANIAQATIYSCEYSDDQTWADDGSTSTTTEYVTVRSYVPGSNYVTYKTVAVYTPTYSSQANALGDIVGSVFNIYGSGTTAFVDPYDGPERTVIYPAFQTLHTQLLAVNDDRLAVGTYYVLGGHAAGKGFIYDVIYDQYTQLIAPNTAWTDLSDINNVGQIIGTSINDDGGSRKGFVYDCRNGFEMIHCSKFTDLAWIIPKKIDDNGNIYGMVSGIEEGAYFIARPDSDNSDATCSLVPRDDVAELIVFDSGISFELSGDQALGVKIGDFDGGGINDLLIYHETNKTILYLGETEFDQKIRYYGDEFNTLAEGIDIATEWDFNNDGFIDNVVNIGTENLLYVAKANGSYYYVPQKLPAGHLSYGDLNGDGLVDFVTFSGGFASISYQTTLSAVTADPVTSPDPVTDTSTAVAIETIAGSEGGVPAIDPDAQEVESVDTIAEVKENSVILASGKELWFSAESIIKFNDAAGFEIGQTLEFKAWENPDGALIGIKVEVA